MTTAALSLDDVHTHIGQFHILHGVSFDVPAGSVTALLGRNGAGKTTTLRTVMGMWQASQGAIELWGRPIAGLSISDIARSGIGYVPENMGIFGQLTVRENMTLAVRNAHIDELRLKRIFGYFPALEKFWNTQAGHLSGGQKQMVAIARAIIEPRRLLLIDEPTKGVAPGIVSAIVEAFRDCVREGSTLLLVEQNYDVALGLAEHVVLLNDGRVRFAGSMAQFGADPTLGEQALGFRAVATEGSTKIAPSRTAP